MNLDTYIYSVTKNLSTAKNYWIIYIYIYIYMVPLESVLSIIILYILIKSSESLPYYRSALHNFVVYGFSQFIDSQILQSL